MSFVPCKVVNTTSLGDLEPTYMCCSEDCSAHHPPVSPQVVDRVVEAEPAEMSETLWRWRCTSGDKSPYGEHLSPCRSELATYAVGETEAILVIYPAAVLMGWTFTRNYIYPKCPKHSRPPGAEEKWIEP